MDQQIRKNPSSVKMGYLYQTCTGMSGLHVHPPCGAQNLTRNRPKMSPQTKLLKKTPIFSFQCPTQGKSDAQG